MYTVKNNSIAYILTGVTCKLESTIYQLFTALRQPVIESESLAIESHKYTCCSVGNPSKF